MTRTCTVASVLITPPPFFFLIRIWGESKSQSMRAQYGCDRCRLVGSAARLSLSLLPPAVLGCRSAGGLPTWTTTSACVCEPNSMMSSNKYNTLEWEALTFVNPQYRMRYGGSIILLRIALLSPLRILIWAIPLFIKSTLKSNFSFSFLLSPSFPLSSLSISLYVSQYSTRQAYLSI